MGAVEPVIAWLKESVRSAQPRPGEGNRNFWLRWTIHQSRSSWIMAGATGT